jgi:hypothetical protein
LSDDDYDILVDMETQPEPRVQLLPYQAQNLCNNRLWSEDLSKDMLVSYSARWLLVKDNCHFATYLLDPRYRDRPLPDVLRRNAERSIKKYVRNVLKYVWADVRVELTEFILKKGLYGTDVFDVKRTENPIKAWEYASTFESSKFLAEVAIRYLSPPAGVQDLERANCRYRRVNPWTRAMLSSLSTDKSVTTQHNVSQLNLFLD